MTSKLNISIIALLVLLLGVPEPLFSNNANKVVLKTVVIDAGHGGHDPGTVSPDRKIRESSINLDVALKLGARIRERYPEVKVIYTRTTDVFIPLAERANIANKNKADLFISIHVNSVPRNAKSPSGTETFVMGTDKSASNMEVCKIENSVILLEDDYSTTYQGFDPNNPESYIFFNLMQNAYFEQSINMASFVQEQLQKGPIVASRGIKQAPLMVLWRTTMPSVLVEIGFLSNASDRNVLKDRNQREVIAVRLFNAFCKFKSQYDSNGIEVIETPVPVAGTVKPVEDPAPAKEYAKAPAKEEVKPELKPEPKPEVKHEPKTEYSIQIFAVSKKLKPGAPELKGLKEYNCDFINGMYKYSVGNYSTRAEAAKKLSAIKARFPGAFVAEFKR